MRYGYISASHEIILSTFTSKANHNRNSAIDHRIGTYDFLRLQSINTNIIDHEVVKKTNDAFDNEESRNFAQQFYKGYH